MGCLDMEGKAFHARGSKCKGPEAEVTWDNSVPIMKTEQEGGQGG